MTLTAAFAAHAHHFDGVKLDTCIAAPQADEVGREVRRNQKERLCRNQPQHGNRIYTEVSHENRRAVSLRLYRL